MVHVCVVGSVNLDQSYTVPTLPRPGQTVLASATSSTPGGKGGNQAVAAARAGATVSLVAALGDDDAATRLRAHLVDNGVALDGLVEVPGPSGTAAVVVDANGENSIVVASGANARLAVTSSSRELLAAADVVLIQLEIPLETALTAARTAHAAGATVVLNASPALDDDRLSALAEVTDVVVLNEDEARQWPWPVPHVVTTLGARGARHAHGDEVGHVGAPAVQPLDSTGAGDVFAGVLAAEWPTGAQRALRRACAAGALATLAPGAGDCAPMAEAIDDVLDGAR